MNYPRLGGCILAGRTGGLEVVGLALGNVRFVPKADIPAILRALSLLSSLAADRRPGLTLIMDIGQLLSVSVPHNETVRR